MYRALCAGDLSHKITIQRATKSQSATGALIPTWTTFATVWAHVEPLNGKDLIAAQQLQSQITTKATINYRADIDATMQVQFKGVIYVIEAIMPDERFANSLTLMLSSGPVKR